MEVKGRHRQEMPPVCVEGERLEERRDQVIQMITRKVQENHMVSRARHTVMQWQRYIQRKKEKENSLARALTKICWQVAFLKI